MSLPLLVPKNRKPKFCVQLAIQDLTNVPLVSGLVHVRWHMRDSIRSEARGKTERSAIKEHKVEWGYQTSWTSRIVINKSGLLQESMIEFEVSQEMYGGKERHALGKLALNLAEYANLNESTTRRYLLQESKVNSTLKIGIRLDQLSGDRGFRTPELKKAPVFGGITGLLSEGNDIKKRDDELPFGTSNNITIDKAGLDLDQDVYRNSLTRQWQAQAGELDPSDAIDDIFAGSDGWIQSTSQKGGSRDAPMHINQERAVMNFVPYNGNGQFFPEFHGQVKAAEDDEILRSLTWAVDPLAVNVHAQDSTQATKELPLLAQ